MSILAPTHSPNVPPMLAIKENFAVLNLIVKWYSLHLHYCSVIIQFSSKLCKHYIIGLCRHLAKIITIASNVIICIVTTVVIR